MEIENIVSQAKKDIKDFRKKNPNWIIMIWWATATGKSKLSILLSDFFDTEIISADSRQIFRYMNIGTDKVPEEILKKIPHHQINIVNPDERYTAWQRQHDTNKYIEEILKKWKLPIIVWWTWLYIDTIYKNFTMPETSPDLKLREELFKKEEAEEWFLHKELTKIDPEEALKIHPKSTRYLVRALEIYHTTWQKKSDTFLEQDVKRPILLIWLRRDKEETNKKINARIKEMLKSWLIEEVKWLLRQWYDISLQSMQWIGYKETIEYINWKYDIEKLEENIKRATHHLAKKQRSWFRRYIAESKGNPRKNITYKLYEL